MTLRKMCIAPGCDDLAEVGGNRCPDHQAERLAQSRAAKARAKETVGARAGGHLYHSVRWRKERRDHLARHPLCIECQADGLVIVATEVDHIKPHRGDLKLFWQRANWQSLCRPCHSRKTANEVFHGHTGGYAKTNGPNY